MPQSNKVISLNAFQITPTCFEVQIQFLCCPVSKTFKPGMTLQRSSRARKSDKRSAWPPNNRTGASVGLGGHMPRSLSTTNQAYGTLSKLSANVAVLHESDGAEGYPVKELKAIATRSMWALHTYPSLSANLVCHSAINLLRRNRCPCSLSNTGYSNISTKFELALASS